jgi:3D (Asp-Asp-Asp) domain-containing protein
LNHFSAGRIKSAVPVISQKDRQTDLYNPRVVLTKSTRRKTLATLVAAVAFVAAYEVTILDSKFAARETGLREMDPPSPGVRLPFGATAYCKGLTTSAGVPVQSGIAAADPSLLPVGSVIQMDSLPKKYNGIYTVMDTGPAVQGRLVDLYMWSCNEALQFGRRRARLTVLRLGWNPQATTPGFMERMFGDRLFKQPQPPPPLPSRPLPVEP